MPVKIPITEKREWLRSYEEGIPAASIARKVKRNIKTVKKGIEDAQRERDGQVARSELIKGALQKHQDQLLEMVNGIINTAHPPAVGLESGLPILLVGAEVMYNEERRPVVVLNSEDRLEWELLREHLGKNDRLWGVLEQWKKSMVVYVFAKMALRRKAEAVIKSKTSLELTKVPRKPPFVYASAVDDIGIHAFHIALGDAMLPKIEEYVTVDTESGEVKYGSDRILVKAPGQEEEYRGCIISAFKELQTAEELERAVKTYHEVMEAATKLRRVAEEIALIGIVPGRCRICQRLGM